MSRRDRDLYNAYQRRWRAARKAAAPPPEMHPLRVWRTQVQISLDEAGDIIGMSGSGLGAYERGVSTTPEWLLDWLSHGGMSKQETWAKLGKTKPARSGRRR